MSGKGLIVTISEEVPTILNMGEEVIEIYRGANYQGNVTIQIKASKDIGITGSHLLQKMIWERTKLQKRVDELEQQNKFLIEQRMKERGISE